MTKRKPNAKVGRPSLYTLELVDDICHRIADGESLRQICALDGYPDRNTVLRWLGDYPDFAAKYARAREAQADVMDDKILTTADACTPDTAAADRVKIAAYQWRASKLAPKVYGDKVTTEVTGKDGGAVAIEHTNREAVQRAVFLVAKAAKVKK